MTRIRDLLRARRYRRLHGSKSFKPEFAAALAARRSRCEQVSAVGDLVRRQNRDRTEVLLQRRSEAAK